MKRSQSLSQQISKFEKSLIRKDLGKRYRTRTLLSYCNLHTLLVMTPL